METQKFAVLGAHRNTIPAVWYDRCVTKCAVVKGLNKIRRDQKMIFPFEHYKHDKDFVQKYFVQT